MASFPVLFRNRVKSSLPTARNVSFLYKSRLPFRIHSFGSEDVFTTILRSNHDEISPDSVQKREKTTSISEFSDLTSVEIINSLLNLQLASSKLALVTSKMILSRPDVMDYPLLTNPLKLALKKTIFSHFCAGENIEEASRTLERMWQLKLKGILDFCVEDAEDDASCDRNLRGFLNAILSTKSLPTGSVSFICVKLSALCPLATLEKASLLLRWHNQHQDHPIPWLLPSFPVLSSHSTGCPADYTPLPLTSEEEQRLLATMKRMNAICQSCEEYGIPLLVDAEYASIQPIVDHLVYAATISFNSAGSLPLVYVTIQSYMRDAQSRLQLAVQAARDRGLPLGVKLVRGAYLTRERREAAERNTGSPVFDTVVETHGSYNCSMRILMEAIAVHGPASPAALLATHNGDSVKQAMRWIDEMDMQRNSPTIQFAQLKGMADGLSLFAANNGYNVRKYLPFGPVLDVVPYLLRRLEENEGAMAPSVKDRELLWNEMWRRLYSYTFK